MRVAAPLDLATELRKISLFAELPRHHYADVLARANPRYWPRAAMRAAMRGHLDMTLAEAGHELAGQYAASVADYDEVHHHILGMADVLSSGIVHAFPRRFR